MSIFSFEAITEQGPHLPSANVPPPTQNNITGLVKLVAYESLKFLFGDLLKPPKPLILEILWFAQLISSFYNPLNIDRNAKLLKQSRIMSVSPF